MEYVLREDEDQTKVVQELLANADHPDQVVWRPRSDVPHGGVYEVADEVGEKLLAHRRARADAEQQRVEEAQAAADERDSAAGVAEGLLTPAEAGFAASRAGDPGGPADPDQPGTEVERDADELDDDAWREKYGDLPRPAAEDEGDDEPPAEPATEEPPAPRKKARRSRATQDKAADPAEEESK